MIQKDDEYGIFIVKDLLNEKRSDGHRLYLIECKECHKQFKKDGASFAYKNKVKYICNHITQKELKEKEWGRIEHYCKECGKPIVTKYGSGIYCSVSCANKQGSKYVDYNKVSNWAKNNPSGFCSPSYIAKGGVKNNHSKRELEIVSLLKTFYPNDG